MNGRIQRFYEFGEYRIEREERLLKRADEVVPLPPKAVELLFVLLASGGRVLTKDELMSLLWADSFVEESNLAQNIFLLRKVLGGGKNGGGKFIETIPRRGYRFVADVRQANQDSFIAREQTLTQIVVEEEIETGDEKFIETIPRRGDRFVAELKETEAKGPQQKVQNRQIGNRKIWAGSAVVLLLVLTGLLVYRFTRENIQTNPPETPLESIAVMPFQNESGNDDVEYLSDGMTETLISRLSQIPGLSVKPRSSVFRYKGKDVPAMTVGAELNVQAVLYGRLIQRGDDLTLFLALIETQSENQIWGKQYVRKLDNLLVLQSEIARDVSENLRPKLSGTDKQKLAKNYTENVEAYNLYLQGSFWWNKFTEDSIRKAIRFFEKAIEKDRNYALAYTGLANSYSVLGINGHMPVIDARPKARSAAETAIALDDQLAEAHHALGASKLFFDWDFAGAELEFKLAMELDPGYAHPHELYAYVLRSQRRFDEAIAEAKKALELDPLNLLVNEDLGTCYRFAGRAAEAVEINDKVIEMDPNFADVRFENGLAHSQLGNHEIASQEIMQGLALSENSTHIKAGLGIVYARTKRRTAQKVIDELIAESGKRYVSPLDIALVYSVMGERDKAFEWLEKAFLERSPWLFELNVDPEWEPIRDDPRFQALARRVGLTK